MTCRWVLSSQVKPVSWERRAPPGPVKLSTEESEKLPVFMASLNVNVMELTGPCSVPLGVLAVTDAPAGPVAAVTEKLLSQVPQSALDRVYSLAAQKVLSGLPDESTSTLTPLKSPARCGDGSRPDSV